MVDLVKPDAQPHVCCAKCVFFVKGKALGQGDCHRFPPTILPTPKGEAVSIWTPVKDGHWCGEYADRAQVRA